MTTFKLQKLVYYSQAASLVWDEAPLFKEKFYAWANGPVCVELYNHHKGKFYIKDGDINGRGHIGRLSDKQTRTIDAVIRAYGRLSGQQLSILTHKEAPWLKARKRLPIGERGHREISLDSIVEYYSAIYLAHKVH